MPNADIIDNGGRRQGITEGVTSNRIIEQILKREEMWAARRMLGSWV